MHLKSALPPDAKSGVFRYYFRFFKQFTKYLSNFENILYIFVLKVEKKLINI